MNEDNTRLRTESQRIPIELFGGPRDGERKVRTDFPLVLDFPITGIPRQADGTETVEETVLVERYRLDPQCLDHTTGHARTGLPLIRYLYAPPAAA